MMMNSTKGHNQRQDPPGDIVASSPAGYRAITIDDETFELLTPFMVEYDCESVADTATTAAQIALQQDDAALAELLADRLAS